MCFNDTGGLMQLIIYFEGDAFVFYHREDKCIESAKFEEGGRIAVFFDEKNCYLHQTFRDFPPKIMFGLTSRGKEEPLKVCSMEMDLKLEAMEMIMEVISLTVIADSVSAKIS